VATYILTWNPDRWQWPEESIAVAVDVTLSGQTFADQWSTGNRIHGIAKNHRAFLLRQHRERGIVASGRFTSTVFRDRHWDGSNRSANYAKVAFDTVLPVEDRLPTEELRRRIPQMPWDRLEASGIELPAANESELESAWAEHCESIPYRAPDELPPGDYEEGAAIRIEVNRYERDRAARKACIAHHGTVCTVCGFDYEQRYGPIGRGFIHVHHVREISKLGAGYKIDPRTDLVPLCANCHAMVHRSSPLLLPSELARRLRRRR
jgi:5-methylcytosine-specific restriction enzyme A